MRKKDEGLLFAVISAITGSIAAVLASAGTKLINPILFAGMGSLLTFIILYSISFVSRPKLKIKMALSKFKKELFLLTLFRPILGQTILLVGFSLTIPIKVVFFTKLEPIFVLLWGYILFKEKIRTWDYAFIALLIFGGLLLSTGADISAFSQAHLGDFLIVISLIFFSYTYFVGSKLAKSVGARTSNVLSSLFGSIIIIPLSFFIFNATVSGIPMVAWLYFIGFVIGFNVIALTLWYAALKRVKGWIVSALRAIGPVTGAVAAFFLFGNVLDIVQIVGAAIILVSSSFITLYQK